MTHERDLAHATARTHTSNELDAIAPGRAARTEQLIGPHGPRPSGLIMRKASGTVSPDAEQAVGAAASSSGERLPDELRTRFEGSLGTDLADVRVHTGAASADAAMAVGARAYATGNDIHFAAGEYQPHSPAGQELIAHEVAHTVQQRGGGATRQHKLAVSSSGDHAEVEADRAASAMVSGSAFTVGGAASGLYRSSLAPKVSGGVALTNSAIKLSVSAKLEPIEVKTGYFKIVLVGALSAEGTLSEKQPPKEGEKEDPASSPEAHREEAQSAGSEALKTQVTEALTEKAEGDEQGWEVPELEKGTGGAGGISLTFKFKILGKQMAVKISALELAKGKAPEFAQMSIDMEVARKQKQLWENDKLKLDAAATVTASIEIKPNWEKILPKLSEQAATKLRPFLSDLAKAALGDTIIDGGFLLIGISVLGVLALGASALADMDAAEKAAKDQVTGFGDGFSTALGAARKSSQDAAAFKAGEDHAHAAMDAQISKIQNHPLFSAYGFSHEELEQALREAAAPQAAKLTARAEEQAKPGINAKVAKAFYDKTMASTFGTYSDAYALAVRLGAEHAIPPRKD